MLDREKTIHIFCCYCKEVVCMTIAKKRVRGTDNELMKC